MKNKIYIYIIIFLLSFFITKKINSEEIFNFNVSELAVTEEGNLFRGSNGGEASTDDGISIKAQNFEYNKINNILTATENVIFADNTKNVIITAEQITYEKNKENIIATGNVYT